jgi:hypothetical protein
MTQYHATLIDETGCEFGATIDIDDGVENVTQYIREMYPESKLVVVEPAAGLQMRASHDAVWQQRWNDDTWDLH